MYTGLESGAEHGNPGLSAMASLPHLDHRQRAVFSLALIAAGLVLLAGGTARQAVGIALSALAIAWAIAQPSWLNLNRRHRAVISLTILASGLGLVAGYGFKISLGVASLGLGLAWAIGSDYRLVHALFLWAIAQPSWLNLNRRHRAVISLTILASGLGLAAGYGFKISLGVASLGLGLAWAIGSNYRLVHALFLLCGVSLITGPLILDWRNHLIQAAEYNHRLADHKNRLEGFHLKASQLAELYPLGSKGPPFSILGPLPSETRTKADAYEAFYDASDPADLRKRLHNINIPETAKADLLQARFKVFDNQVPFPNLPRPVPKWAAYALALGVDVVSFGPGLLEPQWKLELETRFGHPGPEPSPFSLLTCSEKRAGFIATGVVLSCLCVGLIFGVKRP